MVYKERQTTRNKLDDKYIYMSKTDRSSLANTLGLYEDFCLSPCELAETLISYEMSKPSNEWDMDKLELWTNIMKRASAPTPAE